MSLEINLEAVHEQVWRFSLTPCISQIGVVLGDGSSGGRRDGS